MKSKQKHWLKRAEQKSRWQSRYIEKSRRFLLGKSAAFLSILIMEKAYREKRSHLPVNAQPQDENDRKILQAAENGDWGPAEQLLAEMSAGGLALLKRYHIEDKGPYPKEFARLRYDD